MGTDRDLLRKKFKSQREQLGITDLKSLGQKIAERLFLSEWYRNAYVVHCFSGTPEKGEIATDAVLSYVIRSEKQLVMPRLSDRKGEMEHYRVDNLNLLKKNKFGIMEPPKGERVWPVELDLVLVPGLAVDMQGNRIGYGKGFYDRFLASTPAHKLMLLPEQFIVDHIPNTSHDIPVEGIVTEERLIIL
ncbi:MAG: 5-formyltetrahydrofolate cyclo-ligase [Balneolales bacterium]